jgi:hypothetical protein
VTDQISHQARQAVILTIRGAIFDHKVLVFAVSRFTQALEEGRSVPFVVSR